MTARSPLPAERTVQLDIQILGREYKVACKEHERAELLEAVGFLDQRMREIRDGGKISGADRIAVMAALNLANELLRERRRHRRPLLPQRARLRPALTGRTRGVESFRCKPPSTRRWRVRKNCFEHVNRAAGRRSPRPAALPVNVPCGVRVGQSLFEPMLS